MLDVKALLTKILNFIISDNGTWKSINAYLYYSKRGGNVYIQGVSSGNVTLTAASWNNIGTLPVGYRPNKEIAFTAFDRNHLQPLWCSVTTAGVVRLYCDSGQSCSYWVYGGSFPVGGVVKRLLSALTPERGWVAC